MLLKKHGRSARPEAVSSSGGRDGDLAQLDHVLVRVKTGPIHVVYGYTVQPEEIDELHGIVQRVG